MHAQLGMLIPQIGYKPVLNPSKRKKKKIEMSF